jgi:exosortase/archaeosortase family protein
VGDLKSINIFLVKIFGFFFIWLISDNWLTHVWIPFNYLWTYFYHILLEILNSSSALGLEILGYEVVNNYRSVAILGSYGVVIGNHCVGFGLTFAFVALIISYPGPWRKKLWFVPLGVALIMLSNIIRVMTLAISTYNKGGFVDLNQHDFFNYVIYALIFVLWVVWIQIINTNKPAAGLTSSSPASG